MEPICDKEAPAEDIDTESDNSFNGNFEVDECFGVTAGDLRTEGTFFTESLGPGSVEKLGATLVAYPQAAQPSNFGSTGPLFQIEPHKVRFSHTTISSRFRDGREIKETIAEVVQKSTDIREIPRCSVVWHNGNHWSISNRRLATFRWLEMLGQLVG